MGDTISGPVVLHDYWRSSSAWRVRIALNLKGIAFTSRSRNLLAGEQRDPAFLAQSPQGLVPALEVEGEVLTQSVAIIEWLDERVAAPRLLPVDAAARAKVRAMAAIIVADIQPLQNLRVLRALKRQLDVGQEAIDAWVRHWIGEGFTALEAEIVRHGRGFCFDDTPTLVDCVLVPQMYNAHRYGLDMTPFPAIRAVSEACQALPAFAAAHPDAHPDKPEET